MSSTHVQHSEELKIALSSFVARNEEKQAARRAEVLRKDQVYSTASEKSDFKEQLKMEAPIKKPILKKNEVSVSNEENKPHPEEDLTEMFKGLVRLAQGSLETQMKGQGELSEMNRQTGQATLKQTQIALEKQGTLLEKQNVLNEKIQKTGGMLGTMNTVFLVLGFVPLILSALSGIGTAASGLIAGAMASGAAAGGEAAAAGAGEAVAAAASSATAEAAGSAAGLAGEALAAGGEDLAVKAGSEALAQGSVEAATTEGSSTIKAIIAKLKNPRTVLGFAGRIQGITPLYLTARFQKQVSNQHFELAQDVESVGQAMGSMSQMKSILTFFQQATARLSSNIDQMAGQSGEIIKSAKEAFKTQITMSNFMAQAV